jgi:heme exporter protein D
MREFLAMGGYAAYVWSAYAIALAVLVLNVILARRAERTALDTLTRELMGNDDDATP